MHNNGASLHVTIYVILGVIAVVLTIMYSVCVEMADVDVHVRSLHNV